MKIDIGGGSWVNDRMKKAIWAGFGLVILAAAMTGGLRAQEVEEAREAAAAGRITFATNLGSDPCDTCQYNSYTFSGYFVWGPDNCEFPGDVQSLAVPFVAAASGIPDRVTAGLILYNPDNCPGNRVTIGLYTDTCGNGPGTRLAQTSGTVAEAVCGLTRAKFTGAPALTAGVKYWITATTNAAQSALDSRWHPSNNARYSYNAGDGWQVGYGATPSFSIQGSGSGAELATPEASRSGFGGNLVVDPCTGCNYDPSAAGFDVRGPDNCSLQGQLNWEAVPFVASRSGVPKRISAALILHDPTFCPYNKVTLSIYSDNACNGTPGSSLVSAEATVPVAPCDLATANLRNAPSLVKNTKYWVVATTTEAQSHLYAGWKASNNAQLAIDLGDHEWVLISSGTPAFLVE